VQKVKVDKFLCLIEYHSQRIESASPRIVKFGPRGRYVAKNTVADLPLYTLLRHRANSNTVEEEILYC
jgi:hypothetical protein